VHVYVLIGHHHLEPPQQLEEEALLEDPLVVLILDLPLLVERLLQQQVVRLVERVHLVLQQ